MLGGQILIHSSEVLRVCESANITNVISDSYNYGMIQTRSEVGPTGFCSGVNREIYHEHTEILLPALPTKHLILCSNQMMT